MRLDQIGFGSKIRLEIIFSNFYPKAAGSKSSGKSSGVWSTPLEKQRGLVYTLDKVWFKGNMKIGT